MNNTNNPHQSSLIPDVSRRQPRQSQSPTTAADHPPAARLVTVNKTVTTYQKSASQIYQRRQLYQQQQLVIRQHATVIQTQMPIPARMTAPSAQATPAPAPAPASVSQARNAARARAFFNRRVYLDNRGSTVPSALRARLAGLHVDAILHFDRYGNLRGYSYRHNESILGRVNEWGGVASGHGLFTI
ncbi:hypothetical protein CEP51_003745 [Fusarium floridanum]|uniref:Uncharacterized protein n=1 Tax=Fusarium floridanum TaxID=1325733 RepID=A0A428S4M8_9HYPO|nr:hypothetical protein CEP51_003745 [Fusarium floridanum]